ncbi:MAG: lipid-A-disaccharide synthase [Gemmatimonadota bacterium]|nr:lipid-A-disaccharide synthase [Gemmatimonadota bacterium]
MSAGESSGDHHGAAVAREIRRKLPEARLFGIGGREMDAAGVSRIAGLDELSVMGGTEVLRRLPGFLRLERRIRRLFVTEDVRLFLPIDYPGLNLRLARSARRQGRRVLYYIAPQVWAWREGRARKLRRDCDRVLTVLPFEAALLARYGVPTDFVGHPLLDATHAPDRGAGARATTGSGVAMGGRPSDSGRVIGLFPGSREQEVRCMLPVFAQAARELAGRHRDLDFIIARPPHLPESLYAEAGFPTAGAREATTRSWAALTKSGTITLELALAGVPMVVGYRMGRVEWAIGRRLVRVPSIVLVNLVAEAPVVPEFLQDGLTAEGAAAALETLLHEGAPARREMLRGFDVVRERLGQPGCARRVARHAIELLADPDSEGRPGPPC